MCQKEILQKKKHTDTITFDCGRENCQYNRMTERTVQTACAQSLRYYWILCYHIKDSPVASIRKDTEVPYMEFIIYVISSTTQALIT